MEGQITEIENLNPGDKIGNRYLIESSLGEGGMGCVYLATDLLLEGHQVALKVLHKSLQENPEFTARFLREVQIMHRVNHANVVRTYDVGQDERFTFFTMELVVGQSMADLMDDVCGPLEIDQAIDLAAQIVRGLKAIHDCDIIHRDLKPANILILEGDQVKITDFGVAKPKASNLTQHDGVFGTVTYMAPEVMLGHELTNAADFYSFGIILYELLTGQVPFDSDVMAQQMMMHVKKAPQPPKELVPEIPEWLNNLVLKLLAKKPEERLGADALLDLLEASKSGHIDLKEVEKALRATVPQPQVQQPARPHQSHHGRSRSSAHSSNGSLRSSSRGGNRRASSAAVYQQQRSRARARRKLKKFAPFIMVGVFIMMFFVIYLFGQIFSAGQDTVLWFKDIMEGL